MKLPVLRGVSVEETLTDNTKQITIEKVIELSAKGEDLTWKDFKDYSHIDTGKSGYQLFHHKIDDTFELIVSGMWTNKPDGIELVLIEDNTIGVDIREEDIKTFVEQYSKN